MVSTDIGLEEAISILDMSSPSRTGNFYRWDSIETVFGENHFSSAELYLVSENSDGIEYALDLGFEHVLDDEKYPESIMPVRGFLPSEKVSGLGKNTFEKLRRQKKFDMNNIDLVEDAAKSLKSVKNEIPYGVHAATKNLHEENIETVDKWMDNISYHLERDRDKWDKEPLVELSLASDSYKKTVEEAVRQYEEEEIKKGDILSKIGEYNTKPRFFGRYAHTLFHVGKNGADKHRLPDLQTELPDFLYEEEAVNEDMLLEHPE